MQIENMREKQIDRLFKNYLESRIDTTDHIQAVKEDDFEAVCNRIAAGGLSPVEIEQEIGRVTYSFARAGFHAGFKAGHKS